MLRNLLRSHPNLTFPSESHFIPRMYYAYGDPDDDAEAWKVAERILLLPRIKRWGLSIGPDRFVDARSYAEVVSRIYVAWAERAGKPRWGDKTPKYVMHIPLLASLFASSKFIHIYRDGRDVALSWLQLGDEPRNVFTAARRWKRYVSAGRAHGTALGPDRYIEVHFEELLSRPEDVLRSICEFIDEPYTEELQTVTFNTPPVPPREGRPPRSIVPVRRQSRPQNPARRIVGQNSAKWKTEMSLRNQVIFESIAGDLLSMLGYETVGYARAISPVEAGFWKMHQYAGWIAHRLSQRGTWATTAGRIQLGVATARRRVAASAVARK